MLQQTEMVFQEMKICGALNKFFNPSKDDEFITTKTVTSKMNYALLQNLSLYVSLSGQNYIVEGFG